MVSSDAVNYQALDGSWHPIGSTLDAAGADRYAGVTAPTASRPASSPNWTVPSPSFSVGGRGMRPQQRVRRPATARSTAPKFPTRRRCENADLTYRVVASGVKEILDLAGPDAPASYTFRLSPTAQAAKAARSSAA
jgi:hypothetical protein